MDWNAVFAGANLIALVAWFALIVLPRWPALLSGLLFLVVGGLCALYTVLLVSVLAGWWWTGRTALGRTVSRRDAWA